MVFMLFQVGHVCVLCLTVEATSTGASQDEADDANSPIVSDDDDR